MEKKNMVSSGWHSLHLVPPSSSVLVQEIPIAVRIRRMHPSPHAQRQEKRLLGRPKKVQGQKIRETAAKKRLLDLQGSLK